jgi:hypothetical protein
MFSVNCSLYQSCPLNSAWSAEFTRAQISVILQTHPTTDVVVGMKLVAMEGSSAIHVCFVAFLCNEKKQTLSYNVTLRKVLLVS